MSGFMRATALLVLVAAAGCAADAPKRELSAEAKAGVPALWQTAISKSASQGSKLREEYQPIGGRHKTTPPTLTNDEQSEFALNNRGALHVSIQENATGTTAQNVSVSSWFGSQAPSVGQKAMASSLPVAIASDQSMVNVETEQPAAGAATPLHVRATDGTTAYDIAKASQLPSALGAQTSAGSTSFVLASDHVSVGTTEARLPGALTAGGGVKAGLVDALPAGSAVIGQVSIDQTTPGTTNLVQVGGSLPAGTNAIGKLSANSGVDIGDVDVTSVVPGTGATNLGKAEDSASADLDVGVALMAIRKLTPGNTSGTDGDYEALQMSAGRLWTSATIDAALPTGGNTIGTVNVGTFPDNEPINVAQMNGVAVSMGAGANGTGVQRVTIATDQGAITTQLPPALVGGRLDTVVGAALPAGTNILGKVGIDQTTPGTTDSVSVATAQGAGATIGVTTGAGTTTDANATIQQYLRGLIILNKASSTDINTGITADVDAAVAASAGLRLIGFSARESAGTAAAATFQIVNGATGAAAGKVFTVELNGDESRSEWFGPNGIDCANGISIDWIAGTVDVYLHYIDVE